MNQIQNGYIVKESLTWVLELLFLATLIKSNFAHVGYACIINSTKVWQDFMTSLMNLMGSKSSLVVSRSLSYRFQMISSLRMSLLYGCRYGLWWPQEDNYLIILHLMCPSLDDIVCRVDIQCMLSLRILHST